MTTRTPYWIRWATGSSPEWVAMGPGGAIGGFDDRIDALAAVAEALHLDVSHMEMGHLREEGAGSRAESYWASVTPRDKPYEPPHIPPTLDWRIPDLLQEGSPVVDTGVSAQWGYRGTIIDRGDGLRVNWAYPPQHAEGSSPYMVTSITGGTGLDLSLRRGRNRAVDWIVECVCEHVQIDNRAATTPAFEAFSDQWRIQIIPGVSVEFAAGTPALRQAGSVAVILVPALGSLATTWDFRTSPCNTTGPQLKFDDGGQVEDALAIKAIVEWVYEHPDELAITLGAA